MDPFPTFAHLPNARGECGLRRSVTLLCCFSLNADQPTLTYLHGGEAFRGAFDFFCARMMKTLNVSILLITGIFVLGSAAALRTWMQGDWSDLGVVLICLGALLIGTATAAQITTAPKPKRSQNRFFDEISWVLVDPSGWLILVILVGDYSVFLGAAVFLCYVQFALLLFLSFEDRGQKR